MSYDYNSSRNRLVLPEYGRNIQRMVEHIISVPDRDERNRLARSIIGIMGNMNPHLRDISDFTHKLWDHLAIMSHFQLDIDSPYPVPPPQKFTEKPRRVEYKKGWVKYKHYGRIIKMMIEEALKLPEGKDREDLVKLIANQMKKSYLTWNKDVVDDELIFKDLGEMSDGQLKVAEGYKLSDQKEMFKKKKKFIPSSKK